MKKLWIYALSLAAIPLCSAAQTSTNENAKTEQGIEPGDVLIVELRKIAEPERVEGVVNEQGLITMGYIGEIQVSDKTPSELEKIIRYRADQHLC